jgi:c-di-AMP phosphodiesterase-like protein
MEIIKERRKLNRAIKNSKNIFLMGHKNLDLDALGSQIGMYMFLKKKKKNCFIIIDDKEHEDGVEKILKELDGVVTKIKSNEIDENLYPKKSKNLLIILDTNKSELVQSKEVLNKINKKLVIDHHELGKSTIKDADIIDDTKVSSTCEMITSLIEYYDVEIDSYYATILLAGIVLDTNNYTLNTTQETFYASYYLTSLGASAKKVQYLLKQNIDDYTERQKLMANIETINEKIALTHASTNTIYRKEDLAKVADTLLFFNNIEASFVIGKIDKETVGISARSLGNYDILRILKKFNGGGDTNSGAATITKTTISKVEQELKKILKEGE